MEMEMEEEVLEFVQNCVATDGCADAVGYLIKFFLNILSDYFYFINYLLPIALGNQL
jgi:hypothetical protein